MNNKHGEILVLFFASTVICIYDCFLHFQVLEIAEDVTPVVSEFKEARVLHVDQASQKIELKATKGVLEDPLATGHLNVCSKLYHYVKSN